MFRAFRKAKAITFATQALEQLLAGQKALRGLDAAFWNEPYVLGFLHGTAGLLCKISSKGKLGGEDLGISLIHIFDNIRPGDGRKTVALCTDLLEDRNHEFVLGMRNGMKCVDYAFGLDDHFGDFDVEEARKLALSMQGSIPGDGGSERGAVGGALQFMLFGNEVRKRLGTYVSDPNG